MQFGPTSAMSEADASAFKSASSLMPSSSVVSENPEVKNPMPRTWLSMQSFRMRGATCRGTEPCLVFLSSDAPFDIHWVDATGQEIPLEAAMQAVKPASATPSKKQ